MVFFKIDMVLKSFFINHLGGESFKPIGPMGREPGAASEAIKNGIPTILFWERIT